MVQAVNSNANTSLLPTTSHRRRYSSAFGLSIVSAVLLLMVAGTVMSLMMGTGLVEKTKLLQMHPTAARASSIHLQMLDGEEPTIPDTRAADQTGLEEGMVRYMVLGEPVVLPECGTEHCKMMRACLVHAGDEENCLAVPILCSSCGERKPCYFAFNKCRLRYDASTWNKSARYREPACNR